MTFLYEIKRKNQAFLAGVKNSYYLYVPEFLNVYVNENNLKIYFF